MDPLEKANHRITELRKEITAKLKVISELDGKIAALTQTVHERDKTIASLTATHAQEVTELNAAIVLKQEELSNDVNNLAASQQALDNARIAFEQTRAKQAKEMSDIKAQMESVSANAVKVQKENDLLRLAALTATNDFQTRLMALHDEHAAARVQHTSFVFELQSLIETQQLSLAAHDEQISRHLLSIKSCESTIMTMKEERQQIQAQHTAQVEEMTARHETKVKELTDQYLALTAETQRIVSDIKAQTETTQVNLSTLNHWSTIRDSIEENSRNLKQANARLKKDLDTQIKITQKLEKDLGKEIALLNDNVTTLTQDRDAMQKELNLKKAALKLYKDDHETRNKARAAEDEKARQAALEAQKTAPPSFSFGSLFASKKTKADASSSNVNGTPTRVPTQHPSAQASPGSSDKAFLDLEEEMAVEMKKRVQELSDEKSRVEDELIVAQRQLEQERIVAATLRQQLTNAGLLNANSALVFDPAAPKDPKERVKKDKAILAPENTSKVLSDAITRNRELEEYKRESDKELKKLRALLDVKKAELAEARRSQKTLNTTQGKARQSAGVTSNSTQSANGTVTQAPLTISPSAQLTLDGTTSPPLSQSSAASPRNSVSSP